MRETLTNHAPSEALGNLRINGERLWASLMEPAQIGSTPKGGVCRLALTDLDQQDRDLVSRWARAAVAHAAQSERPPGTAAPAPGNVSWRC